MANQFFLTKSHEVLLEELRGENRLRRVLGPVQLSSLGVGAIIGTGIFVLTGVEAHDRTGPALMLSFVAAGITCIFAALCYAEFASMVPVAGSAYTYAYATLGELFAWIIGWDLVLEYTVCLVTVVLVIGIRESASFNATMVIIKLAVVLFVIVVGAAHVNPANWHPFAP